MRRRCFFLLVLSATLSVSGQSMPSVAEVTFGWTYSQCKQALDTKFNGGKASSQSTPNRLSFYDVWLGGYCFGCAEFDFQVKNGRSYLYYIRLYDGYELSESDKAKKRRDNLFDEFSEKYEYRWDGTNDDGYKYYVLGYDPLESEDGLVVISTKKGKNLEGKMKLWTQVSYGPIYFVKPKDEI